MTVGPVEDGYTVIVEQSSIPGGREAAVAFRLTDRQGEIVKGLPEDSVTASAVHHGLTTTATAPAVRGKGGRWTIALPVLPDGPYSLLVRLARPGEAPVKLRGAFTIGSFTGSPEVTEAERLSDTSAAGFTARLVGERPSGKRSLVSVAVSEGQQATVSGVQDAAMELFGGSDGAQYVSGSLVETESGASASFRVPPLPAGQWAVLVSGTVGGEPVEFHFVVSVK